MKGLLVFLFLISFFVNAKLICRKNEALDEKTQKCIKMCEIGEVYRLDTFSCESNITNTTCPEGKRFNTLISSCEEIIDGEPNPFDKYQYKEVKCEGGVILEDYGCFCPKNKILSEGVCIDETLIKKNA